MKTKVAIIGSGNIGTDLCYKALRSEWLSPSWMVGIDPDSDGLRRAEASGLKVTADGIDGLLPHLAESEIKIVFDATSASAHRMHAEKLKASGILLIDLTPAAIGPYCIPPVNLGDFVGKALRNVNMVSCGGQATVPMVHAISRVQSVEYAEIIATVASKSAGPGTRNNIDEFTRTTARAVEKLGGAKKGKAIIILNPAEPPLIMRDTIHCLTETTPDEAAITQSVLRMVKDVQGYVPGYKLKNGPVFDERRVTMFMEVEGLGDYLPKYAGNLDIMTAAALKTAEMFAQQYANRGAEQ
jgi:acetaldehyde/propanal dehydrogenase